MFSFKTCIILFIALAQGLNAQKEWWETSSFYQIYPRSFKDSDGDGIGDLKGITEKLPYLKSIGIKAFWLSPIFKSPMADFGYDISNFYEIQPEYGTMEDFEALVKRATELEMKVILDFVPNHSSDENDWFKKSVNKEGGYEDFYMWHPGKPNPNNPSKPLPPCNWLSIFRGSAWTWNEDRQEYYFHQFAVKQPDLNFRSSFVVETMKNVLKFWLDKGVGGFRIDATPHLFEIDKDSTGNYIDEPLSGTTEDPNDWGYLEHLYTRDRDETLDMIYQWRKVLDDHMKEHGGDSRVIMTEAYSPIDIVMKYYGNGTHEGAQMPFNFQLMALNKESKADDFKFYIDNWINNRPANRTPNWVVGNHDNSRVASKFGVDRIDSINMIIMSLSGASVTYNGEELGLTDVEITWEETVDPTACSTNSSVYQKYSRDPVRTPFQWDDTKNAGFSNATKTWLPVSPAYQEVNVKVQEGSVKSHLKIYKQLTELRKSKTLQDGTLKYFAVSENVLVILRELAGFDTYVTLSNIGETRKVVDLNVLSGNLPAYMYYEIVSLTSEHKKGNTVLTKYVVLQPFESFILNAKNSDGFKLFKSICRTRI